MNVSPISHRNQDVAQNIRTSRGDMEAVRLYWLPKEIAEMPRVEAPGPRRDEGVDEHPRPRNNAGTGVSTPESEFSFPRSGTSSLPQTISFPQELLAICIAPSDLPASEQLERDTHRSGRATPNASVAPRRFQPLCIDWPQPGIRSWVAYSMGYKLLDISVLRSFFPNAVGSHVG